MAVILGEGKQNDRKISSFLTVWRCRSPYFKGISHQSASLLTKQRQRLSQSREAVRLSCFTDSGETPGLAAFESMLPFVLGSKLIFHWCSDAGSVWCGLMPHLLIWKSQLWRMRREETTQRNRNQIRWQLRKNQSGSDGWDSCAEDFLQGKDFLEIIREKLSQAREKDTPNKSWAVERVLI